MKTCPECRGRTVTMTDMMDHTDFEYCNKCESVVQNIPLIATDDARERAYIMVGSAVHVIIHTDACDAASKGDACTGNGCYVRVVA